MFRTLDPLFALSIGASAAWLRIRREETERFYNCRSDSRHHKHHHHHDASHDEGDNNDDAEEGGGWSPPTWTPMGMVINRFRKAEHRMPQGAPAGSENAQEGDESHHTHTHTHRGHPPSASDTLRTLSTRITNLFDSDGKWDLRDRNEWDRYKEEQERKERQRRKSQAEIEAEDDVGRLERFKRKWKVDDE
ncbi:MAG: hypothetical protein M1831_003155 [Alyxoria varia]|nr:MAG: hypothetical protein M1831_003155 [Alyxoria varia]